MLAVFYCSVKLIPHSLGQECWGVRPIVWNETVVKISLKQKLQAWTHHCCHWFFSPIFCVIIPNALGLSAFPALRSLLDSQSSIETISDMALTNIRLINSAGFFSCFARTWLPDTADTVLGLKLLLLFFTENKWKKKSNKNLLKPFRKSWELLLAPWKKYKK